MESDVLPILYLQERTLFPRCTIELPVKGRFRRALAAGDRIAVYSFRKPSELISSHGRIVTLASVSRIIEGKGEPMAEIRGEKRLIVDSRDYFRYARCHDIAVKIHASHEDLPEQLRKKAQEFVFLINIPESDRLIYLVNFIQGLSDIADFIAHYFIIDPAKKSSLYNEIDPGKRGELLETYLDAMITDLRKVNEV